ncbi:MAG: SWIM zinc finger family protein [Nocardioides sp.]
MAGPVVHPRITPRRGARATRWWAKAWVRAVEESAYAEQDLAAARTLARSGRVGAIATEPGRFAAVVDDDRGPRTVTGSVPVLDDASLDALVETVAAEAGRVAALLAGDLPHTLVEHAEEAGVELLPYGGELGSTCTCEAWVDPCVHALGVLYQLAWLVEADPFVLLALRGLPRDDLLARLHDRAPDEVAPEPADGDLDVEAGVDAALRAARVLEVVTDPDAGDRVDHLF